MDLSGLFSKLSRPALALVKVHRQLRDNPAITPQRIRSDSAQRIRLAEAELREAEARYLAGATLRESAAPLGISHMRLGTLLKERGVEVRGSLATETEVDLMVMHYENGESLARIGKRLGYQPNTVRNRLLSRGVTMRDSRGRGRGEDR